MVLACHDATHAKTERFLVHVSFLKQASIKDSPPHRAGIRRVFGRRRASPSKAKTPRGTKPRDVGWYCIGVKVASVVTLCPSGGIASVLSGNDGFSDHARADMGTHNARADVIALDHGVNMGISGGQGLGIQCQTVPLERVGSFLIIEPIWFP